MITLIITSLTLLSIELVKLLSKLNIKNCRSKCCGFNLQMEMENNKENDS